jgi:hypothetical protein
MCQDKPHSTIDLWHNIWLHGIKLPSIRLHGIRLLGIRPHGIKLLSISGISSDLFLPIRMANSRKKNQGTT